MKKFYFRLSLFLAVVLVSISVAEVFKWIDSEGNIHYRDYPPDKQGVKKLDLNPPPSQAAIDETRQIKQRYEEMLEANAVEDLEAFSLPIYESEEIDAVSFQEPECFSALAEYDAYDIPEFDDRAAISVLTDDAVKAMADIFTELEKFNRATIDHVECVSPNKAIPEEFSRHDAVIHADWQSSDVFRIKADIRNRGKGVRHQEFHTWRIKEGDTPGYMKDYDDSVFDQNAKRYEINLLSADKDQLAIIRQYRLKTGRGGSCRCDDILQVHNSNGTYLMIEYHYLNEKLAEKKTWKFDR